MHNDHARPDRQKFLADCERDEHETMMLWHGHMAELNPDAPDEWTRRWLKGMLWEILAVIAMLAMLAWTFTR